MENDLAADVASLRIALAALVSVLRVQTRQLMTVDSVPDAAREALRAAYPGGVTLERLGACYRAHGSLAGPLAVAELALVGAIERDGTGFRLTDAEKQRADAEAARSSKRIVAEAREQGQRQIASAVLDEQTHEREMQHQIYGAEIAAIEALGISSALGALALKHFLQRYVFSPSVSPSPGGANAVTCVDCGAVAEVRAGRRLAFPHATYCATAVIEGRVA